MWQFKKAQKNGITTWQHFPYFNRFGTTPSNRHIFTSSSRHFSLSPEVLTLENSAIFHHLFLLPTSTDKISTITSNSTPYSPSSGRILDLYLLRITIVLKSKNSNVIKTVYLYLLANWQNFFSLHLKAYQWLIKLSEAQPDRFDKRVDFSNFPSDTPIF